MRISSAARHLHTLFLHLFPPNISMTVEKHGFHLTALTREKLDRVKRDVRYKEVNK